MESSNYTVDKTDHEYELTPRRKFMLSLDIIFFIIGFFGNGSVIYLTIRHPGLRSIPNLMIANLAVGDMLVVILVIFTNTLYYFLQSIRVAFFHYCEFFLFVQFLSQGVSILTLTALSIDRYTVVLFPLRKQRYARKATIWTVVVIWVISLAIVCPMFGIVDAATCWIPDGTSYTAYILFLALFLFIVPALVMVVCYFLTAKQLLFTNNDLKLDPQGGQRQRRKRSRLAIIVLIMTIVFILSSSLTFIWIIVYRFSPTNLFVTNAHIARAKSVLIKFNSIINPVILYSMSTTYRRHLKVGLVDSVITNRGTFTTSRSVLHTSIQRQPSQKTESASSLTKSERKMLPIQEETNL
ncbi:neuropeptide CCHamide-1 receptor-like [Amphiura filiformis]|uniref:neuropeptide CCHamide-1 receptor-like n=1 Tax=Amphiura filiformis TaxID=82378 RepID=UPI003B21CB84